MVLADLSEEKRQLNTPEMKLTEGLSPYAYKVYHDLAGKLSKAPGTAYRAARMGAFLYAMHADRVAEAMKRAAKKAGKNPDSITALDVYKRFNLQLDGQSQNGALNQLAWHGSPHNFESFDLGAVGSGSGANFHGWGLYFAHDKEVADIYNWQLSEARSMFFLDRSFLGLFHKKISFSGYDIKKTKLSDAERAAVRALIARDYNQNAAIELLEYFAHEEKNEHYANAAKILRKNKIATQPVRGSLFQVEVPENEEMLDENKTFAEQTSKIKEQLRKIGSWNDDATGEDIYATIKESFINKGYDAKSAAKEASMLLRENGIKGITYDAYDEGRCYVVFDDKAVSIIEKINTKVYNQLALDDTGIKGAMWEEKGKRIIALMENADESTFVHELGHLFLKDLEALALIDEQSAQDLAEVNAWADYKKGDENKYEGTSFDTEFKMLAKNIEAAEAAGQIEKAASLKDRWRQERFARGFEMYLQHGKAPNKGLQSVFHKFKSFLTNIYFGFKNEGVRANAKVERAMNRMIASDDGEGKDINYKAFADSNEDVTRNIDITGINDSTKVAFNRIAAEYIKFCATYKNGSINTACDVGKLADEIASHPASIIEDIEEQIKHLDTRGKGYENGIDLLGKIVELTDYHKYSDEKIERRLKENDPYLNWSFICKYEDLSESFMERHADELDWKYASIYQKMSEGFIERHADKVDWKVLASRQDLSLEFIEKYEDRIDWRAVFHKYNLPEAFIERHIDKANWYEISMHQPLSEPFMEKYRDKLDWDMISSFQVISESFIEANEDLVNWENISFAQKLSEAFIEKHADKLDWKSIAQEQELSLAFVSRHKQCLDMDDLRKNSKCNFTEKEIRAIYDPRYALEQKDMEIAKSIISMLRKECNADNYQIRQHFSNIKTIGTKLLLDNISANEKGIEKIKR